MNLKPQKGFQEKFLSCTADIAIGGGAAGVGKTFCELLEPLRHHNNPDFGAVIFRRTYSQITLEGGLWDSSQEIYPLLGATPNESQMSWKFPSGMKVSFRHLQHEKNILDYQGSQMPLVMYDELTHFTKRMFYYMLSRGRSLSGVNPYIRATCNPDPDSWVAYFIDWWIDQDTGFPIPERDAVLRYMTQDGDVTVWGDSPEEVIAQCPHVFNDERLKGKKPADLVKSVTFIAGKIEDNQELLSKNPQYLGNLLALEAEEKQRLLDGNWKIRLDGLMLFDYLAIEAIFDNALLPQQTYYVTCDASRFGRDFTVVFVWKGWEVVFIIVQYRTEAQDIVNSIESVRSRYGIPRFNVLVDQDGVGGGTVKLGKYTGFSGGAQPVREPRAIGEKRSHKEQKVENYANLKTQCVYKVAEENVNTGLIRINVTPELCVVEGQRSTKVKVAGNVVDISTLIKADLRSFKRAERNNDGKLKIQDKDEQKNALNGRSPDFGDNIVMRKYLDLLPKKKGITRKN